MGGRRWSEGSGGRREGGREERREGKEEGGGGGEEEGGRRMERGRNSVCVWTSTKVVLMKVYAYILIIGKPA